MTTLFDYLQVFLQFLIKIIIHLMGDKYAMVMMVEMLEHFAKMTETTLDDEIVALIKQKVIVKQD